MLTTDDFNVISSPDPFIRHSRMYRLNNQYHILIKEL
jgi:hypothetical protein